MTDKFLHPHIVQLSTGVFVQTEDAVYRMEHEEGAFVLVRVPVKRADPPEGIPVPKEPT